MTTFLTIEEAAARLRLGKSSIRSYIRSGKLPAKKLTGGKRVLIEEKDLLGLLGDAHAATPRPTAQAKNEQEGRMPTATELMRMTREERGPFLRAAAESAYPLYMEDLARPEAERVLTADLETGDFYEHGVTEHA